MTDPLIGETFSGTFGALRAHYGHNGPGGRWKGGKYRAENPADTVHMPTSCKHDQLPVSGNLRI